MKTHTVRFISNSQRGDLYFICIEIHALFQRQEKSCKDVKILFASVDNNSAYRSTGLILLLFLNSHYRHIFVLA